MALDIIGAKTVAIVAQGMGGMVSSLVHILIATPVIFAWLRERELRKGGFGKQPVAMAEPA